MDITVGLSRASGAVLHPSVSQGAGAFVSATGVDLQGYEGVVTAVIVTGAITGSVSLQRLQDSDAIAGTYADIPGQVAPADISTANQIRFIAQDVRSCRRFMKFAATVTTGPVLIGVALVGYKKYIPS